MQIVQLKLKQASAVLGVAPKELQNLVQFGVVRPRKRSAVYYFDTNVLLQAKLAFYLKDSLGTPTTYLVWFNQKLSRLPNLTDANWPDLWISASPAKGQVPIEIKVPFRQLKKELEQNLPLAEIYNDLPRGRKRKGWKEEFLKTLKQAGNDVGEITESQILANVAESRSKKRAKPEITVATQKKKTA